MELVSLDSQSLLGEESNDQYLHSLEDPEVSTVDVSHSVDLFNRAGKDFALESEDHLKRTADLEQAALGEPFDLKAYLRDSNTKDMDNGGKPKKMGVVIKNLTVTGEAPETSTISTNLTLFHSALLMCRPSYW